ncbi:hypothetical protein BACCAP_04634 [Pseudoflavonifractor capillosus ATCC 29799]|uniref:Uncharacterized protein n=1 Tax=Pseudoflavonifractor capillosus ATCC 29799 TaxID=411467 RepID=A6P2A4_9FIRM|nr:hypothetical protein BACCAP_04634 [Pseudoflavonifractor capillosus ATCC 29799]
MSIGFFIFFDYFLRASFLPVWRRFPALDPAAGLR